MNIHYSASLLGILKIAQGSEFIQYVYIQISNAMKIGMKLPLEYMNQS